MQEALPLDSHPSQPTTPDFLDRLDGAMHQFADLVVTGDLEAPVPSCPGWSFADLVGHLGGVHQWARHAVIAGNPDGRPTPAPSAQPALAGWYREAADALISTLRNTDPSAPAWTFGPEPRTASFWSRRQAHETTMHLWDAGLSQGSDLPIDESMAADGVDEVIGVFFPRQVRLGRTSPLEHGLALAATDMSRRVGPGDPRRWVLAGDGTGPAADRDAPAAATVTGPAERLLLLLWGRTDLGDPRLAVSGDEGAAHAVLAAAITP
jgi:uncharacterized protein (TIGR03083 family)